MADQSSKSSEVSPHQQDDIAQTKSASPPPQPEVGDTQHEAAGTTNDAAQPRGPDPDATSRPTKVLPTHYRGMPKDWEKNRRQQHCRCPFYCVLLILI